jgi:predicted ribosome quality control (RQC) complex YloA/Tae2 family protein
MKLIEALKNLKTIQKRIEKNCGMIGEYAAYVSVETPAFETEDKQRQEVASLVQSNLDLIKEFLRLKTAIEFTNLNTKVTIGSREHSISELITIRRTSGAFVPATYGALNNRVAMQKLQNVYKTAGGVNPTEPAKLIPLYSEADKNKALAAWDEFFSAIDGKLEVVNAETELTNY